MSGQKFAFIQPTKKQKSFRKNHKEGEVIIFHTVKGLRETGPPPHLGKNH